MSVISKINFLIVQKKHNHFMGTQRTGSMCDYFTSTILLTTDFCGTIPRATLKTTNLMQCHGTICFVKVFLLSEREISPNYTGIFLDFVHGFGSYVKSLPKRK